MSTNGAPKVSLAFKAKSKSSASASAQASRSQKPPSSALALLGDDDNDHDDNAAGGQTESVSHFDHAKGGAVDVHKPKEPEKAPLVIKRIPNKDWREESRRKRQRHGLPAEAQAARRAQAQGQQPPDHKDTNGASVAFGLTLPSPRAPSNGADVPSDAAGVDAHAAAKPKTDDERALDALMGAAPQSTLNIPLAPQHTESGGDGDGDGDDSFQSTFRSAPDMASLEEYAAVPIEEFGAAMLRGMGWKDGEAIGRRRGLKAVQARVVERRPALLGIGAKEEAAVAGEMGSWGKADAKAGGGGGKTKVRKVDQSYNPVVLRDRETGEMMTEEEMGRRDEERKRKAAEAAAEEDEYRRSGKKRRRREDDGRSGDERQSDRRRDWNRDRERDGRRDRDREPYRSSRREREGDNEDDYDGKRDRRKKHRADHDGNADESMEDRDDGHARKKDRHREERREHDRERDRDRDRRRDKVRDRDRGRDEDRRRDKDRDKLRIKDRDRDRDGEHGKVSSSSKRDRY